ncbi:aminodeoxychorismate lyase [Thioalkalivibrio nitratireducens DSM 14787]|uniref:Endolytic murein transglycosylase n=1 Tax=Thioalkalivibrio nitratireducens (strain DSM 14787 / UNIQEM 213 / ALEN2) TaxID=1255043 RepID=L0DW61_THIND|nr:endolytic transglycosylase MltG [Thioalkalivibrio nitratireducens]AGA33252.1 aminodeoxychorismate lyase [Thioalkalivibrio nitratireducens DSM 14787]
MRWLSLFTLFLLIAATLAGAHLVTLYHQQMTAPLDLEQAEVLLVEPGQGFRQIVGEMEARGWVRYPWMVEIHARRAGVADRLQAGEYEILPGLTVTAVLDRMVRGQVIRHRLTVPEGWTARQFFDAVQGHPALRPLPEGTDLGALMADLGRPGQHPEGWFLPDTYLFSRDTPGQQILRQAHEGLTQVLDQAWQNRMEDHPVESPYELLILASIIEKETGQPQERGLVAGVFVNRLRQGMRLQTDPTLLYALEPGETRLTRAELRRDHPYNTYTRDGLPPTPIALPGKASILAAARPTETDARFFVSRNDGTHEFSQTYAEHRAAVIRYQLGGDASRYGGGQR